MTVMVDEYRQLYNHDRPHESLAGDRPIERYLADPTQAASTTAETDESLRIT